MFKSNNNRKRPMKNKKQNTDEKAPENKVQYEEDYNDVILNDLVPEENRKEYGLEEEHKPTKKKGGIKLNLGSGNKRPSKSKKTQQEKPEEKVNNSKNKPKEVVEESKPQGNKKKNTKNTKKSNGTKNEKVESNKGNSKKNQSKKTKGNGKSKLGKQEIDVEEDVKVPDNKNSNKKVMGTKRRRKNLKEDVKEDDVRNAVEENVEVEENIKLPSNKDNISFRSEEEVTENKAEEIKEIKSKFENIVWSEDNFPKK